MAEGKQTESWNHTSQVLAMIANCRPFLKQKHVISAAKFHPFAKLMPKKRLSREDSRKRLDAAFGVKNAKRQSTASRKGSH